MKVIYKYIPKVNILFRFLGIASVVFSSQSVFANELPNTTSLNVNDTECRKNFPDYIDPVIGEKGTANFLGSILTILATALIEEGVDFIGDRLTEAAMAETQTVSASVNILKPHLIDDKGELNTGGNACLTFSHGDNINLIIDLNGATDGNNNTAYMIPTLRSLNYKRTLEDKKNKTRGLMIQLEVQSPLSTTVDTQTLNLGNINSAGNIYNGADKKGLRREFRVMNNPFLSIKDNKTSVNLPLIFTVSLTEVRDANVALQLLADTASNANDDLTRAVIEIVVPQENDDG